MDLKEYTRNCHKLTVDSLHTSVAMLSDIHWDNPKCDRELLKKHLDYCLKEEMPIMINGDFFCLMQGRYDPRRNKKDILPEHNVANYLDAVIEDAVDWWAPYAHLLTVIGYGNHETGIIRNCETDPLRRFVDILNYKEKSNVHLGGYGGWIVLSQVRGGGMFNTKIKYYHGSGGGGVVTKGAINLTRALEMYDGMDVFTMGHIHENSCRTDSREGLITKSKRGIHSVVKDVHLMITGTYKEEYEDGYMGWHIERGAPPKTIGGRILTVDSYRIRDGRTTWKDSEKIVDSRRFNIV